MPLGIMDYMLAVRQLKSYASWVKTVEEQSSLTGKKSKVIKSKKFG